MVDSAALTPERFPSQTHLTGEMQLFENLLQLGVVSAVKVQLAQLGVGFEPEPVVFGVLQRLQGRLIKVLQQLHLWGGSGN